jgi:hypothetical protein
MDPSKAFDDSRVAARPVYNATVAAHNTFKDAGVGAQKVSDDVKFRAPQSRVGCKNRGKEGRSKIEKRQEVKNDY